MAHNPTPQNVINVSGTWSAGHYQRTSGYTYIFYWQGNTNNDSIPRSILYNNTSRKWEDNGAGAPVSFDGAGSSSTDANPQTVHGYANSTTIVWSFSNPYYDSNYTPGPNVSSITATAIFVPSDTVSNTDFTLLKNGSAYANSNISLTGPGAQPPSDARGYTYALTYSGNAWYSRSIDSKSFTDFYYDDSWTSSASSSRSTNSTRILNVLARIPNNTFIGSGSNNPLTTIIGSNFRFMYYTYSQAISGVTTTIDIRFIIDNKIINGVSEIVGYFQETRSANDIPNMTSTSVNYIIGDQETMTYTQSLLGVSTTYYVSDWVYSAEPEGDGYVAPVTTTSNGGGRPDRYPFIMTNLFNRNRSIYSIGMTHKDTWDLFL